MGRARAKARAVKMGRKPKLTPHQQREAIKRRDKGEPMRDIARSCNVSHRTISRLAGYARSGRTASDGAVICDVSRKDRAYRLPSYSPSAGGY